VLIKQYIIFTVRTPTPVIYVLLKSVFASPYSSFLKVSAVCYLMVYVHRSLTLYYKFVQPVIDRDTGCTCCAAQVHNHCNLYVPLCDGIAVDLPQKKKEKDEEGRVIRRSYKRALADGKDLLTMLNDVYPHASFSKTSEYFITKLDVEPDTTSTDCRQKPARYAKITCGI